jgi:hypothetical protein
MIADGSDRSVPVHGHIHVRCVRYRVSQVRRGYGIWERVWKGHGTDGTAAMGTGGAKAYQTAKTEYCCSGRCQGLKGSYSHTVSREALEGKKPVHISCKRVVWIGAPLACPAACPLQRRQRNRRATLGRTAHGSSRLAGSLHLRTLRPSCRRICFLRSRRLLLLLLPTLSVEGVSSSAVFTRKLIYRCPVLSFCCVAQIRSPSPSPAVSHAATSGFIPSASVEG